MLTRVKGMIVKTGKCTNDKNFVTFWLTSKKTRGSTVE